MEKPMKQQILEYLLRHKKITVQDGIRKLHTTELRHYIAQLRQDGHIIVDEWKKGRYGSFKVYKYTGKEKSA